VKVLLVCPEYPDTFWSFKHALRFVSKRAGQPPLGLLTVASLLPPGWEKRLVDLNLRPLTPEDLGWADYVFLGAMSVQAESARSVIERCHAAGKKVVAGGPLFTARHEEFPGVDHLVLNEAELTLPAFLEDLRNGRPRRLYATKEWADLVFLGAMSVQEESARSVIERCNAAGTRVVAGGPLFTARHEEFPGVDHLVLGEAEITLPAFLDDLRLGRPGRLYTTTEWADLARTPLPMWELIDPRQYATMNVQYSRGCQIGRAHV
jgi:radical SAM superfamily enzyme YgiQ (UPF0313 family)